ncbi:MULTISPECIES: hypothetical protein [Aquimarina]|uniref:hypothetical protein n=1 Tax=Aquimarina TaxID=290174 RepID=UPI00040AA174|nr:MULTISPECIES: hypothetical protein [Aquimarina]
MEKQEQYNELEVLTVDELRSYEGLEDLTEEAAVEISKSLYKLAVIGIDIMKSKK